MGATYTDMPCAHGTGSPEVNAFENVTQYSRNVNLSQLNVFRVNTAILNDSLRYIKYVTPLAVQTLAF